MPQTCFTMGDEKMKKLEPVKLYEHNFRDVAQSLRAIADKVEDDGHVVSAAVVLYDGEDVEVFGLGEGDADRIYFVLGLGKNKIESFSIRR